MTTEQHCAHGFYTDGCFYCANKEIERLQKILRDWGICGWERTARAASSKQGDQPDDEEALRRG